MKHNYVNKSLVSFRCKCKSTNSNVHVITLNDLQRSYKFDLAYFNGRRYTVERIILTY